MVRVHRGTKKKSVRHFALEPEVIPLLRHLMDLVGGTGHIARNSARGSDDSAIVLLATGTFGVEPRGIEPLTS